LLGLILAGTATALATGLGAVPVFLLGRRAEALRPALWGLAAGVMGVASVAGLLLPALDEGSVGEVGAGLAAGIVFMLVALSYAEGTAALRETGGAATFVRRITAAGLRLTAQEIRGDAQAKDRRTTLYRLASSALPRPASVLSFLKWSTFKTTSERG